MKKILKNKKGFTLIELLAVIVVLAIIMVIATGSIMNTINNARNQSFEKSFNMIANNIKTAATLASVGNTSSITCSGTDCLDMYGLKTSSYDTTTSVNSVCISTSGAVTSNSTSCSSGVLSGYKVTLVGTGEFAKTEIQNECPVDITSNLSYTYKDSIGNSKTTTATLKNSCSGATIVAYFDINGNLK